MSHLKDLGKALTDVLLGPFGYEVVRRRPRPVRITKRRPSTPPVTPGRFTPDLLRWQQEAAERIGVAATVHPDDFIYWWSLEMYARMRGDLEPGVRHYFERGQQSARDFAALLIALGFPAERRPTVLEFAAGYGAVTRHLVRQPGLEVTSCDIHPAALAFLAGELGVPVIPSAQTPEAFAAPASYDVVLAISFFSHMPKATWGRWVRALHNTVKPGGVLIFTTHGEASRERMTVPTEAVDADGFWFSPHSEQEDLDPAEYGTTVTRPEFVVREVYRQTQAPIVLYQPAVWQGLVRQDLWVVARVAPLAASSGESPQPGL
jgi:SAM-dependent methyltransferase